jgi:hypothetical protein
MRLFIDVEGSDFYGGTHGAPQNFEVEREDSCWKRFETDLAWTPQGEPVLRLRGYATWDVVYERLSEGTALEEDFQSIEDLARYLERCLVPSTAKS